MARYKADGERQRDGDGGSLRETGLEVFATATNGLSMAKVKRLRLGMVGWWGSIKAAVVALSVGSCLLSCVAGCVKWGNSAAGMLTHPQGSDSLMQCVAKCQDKQYERA